MTTKSIPVTMLSGFLGAGKTTLLRELLTQAQYKIGCIVNDVAAVNIDAKLIRNQQSHTQNTSTTDLAPTIELQNGCACCNIQDELWLSFEQVLAVGARNGVTYDRIVLENSGVAEPLNIRDAFADATEEGHPVMKSIHLSTLITVVDSHMFIEEFACRNPMATRPDLGGDESNLRPVVDLLVEQIETADFIVLNKVDMLGAARVPELMQIVKSINPLGQVVSCNHGKVDMERMFGPEARALLASLNTEGQHRGYVQAAKAPADSQPSKAAKGDGQHAAHDGASGHGSEAKKENGHAHTHGHGHEGHAHDGHASDGHGHADGHAHDKDGSGHDHHHDEHSHDHHGHDHHDSHSHDHHGHSHDHGGHSHDGHDHHGHHHHGHHHHDHDHEHENSETTAAKRFGITSFVYGRRRPFHAARLREMVLRWMPVSSNQATETTGAPENNTSPVRTVMRSKGFVWMSHAHSSAFYWSHAGQHFELREEGDWWASVPEEEWPEDETQREVVKSDFAGEFGDRRQEIVFIGVGMDQNAIEKTLDGALLTDEELVMYKSNFGVDVGMAAN